MADAPKPEAPRGFWAVLLGTAPGLESVLFASVPAIVAGSLVYFWWNGWAGLAIGLLVLAVGARVAKRFGN